MVVASVRSLKSPNSTKHRTHHVAYNQKFLKKRHQKHPRAEASHVDGATKADKNIARKADGL